MNDVFTIKKKFLYFFVVCLYDGGLVLVMIADSKRRVAVNPALLRRGVQRCIPSPKGLL
jgi:hypothetical protein